MYAKKEPSFICPARALGCMAVDAVSTSDVSGRATRLCGKPSKSCNGRIRQHFSQSLFAMAAVYIWVYVRDVRDRTV